MAAFLIHIAGVIKRLLFSLLSTLGYSSQIKLLLLVSACFCFAGLGSFFFFRGPLQRTGALALAKDAVFTDWGRPLKVKKNRGNIFYHH